MQRRLLTAVLLAGSAITPLVLLSACAGGAFDTSAKPAVAERNDTVVSGDVDGADDSSGRGSSEGGSAPVDLISGSQVAAKQVRSGTIQLSARRSRVVAVAARVAGIIESLGGSVTSERSSGGVEPAVDLVLAVPPEHFREAVTRVGEAGHVVSTETSTEDVTARYSDLDGRITSMRISVARLQAFLAEADDVSQITQLEAELTRREAELESTQRQLDALDAQVSTSTLQVTVSTDTTPATPPSDGPPSPASALARGWRAFLNAGRWILAAVAVSLPFVVLLLSGGYLALRVRRRQGTATATS